MNTAILIVPSFLSSGVQVAPAGLEPTAKSTADWLEHAKTKGRVTEVWNEEDWESVTEDIHPGHQDYRNVTGKLHKTTYTSPALTLKSGGGHFTLNPLTAIPFPKGSYSLFSAEFRVMDETGTTNVPLSELYLHHWLIGTHEFADPLIPCESSDNMFFGAGAEMRGINLVMPNDYGIRRIDVLGKCGGNLHFIRTGSDLQTNWTGFNNPNGSRGAAIKNCIECGWAPDRMFGCDEVLDGNILCCFTGSRCPVDNPADESAHSYRLEYDVVWSRDLKGVKDIHMGVLDVSGDAIEWDIAPGMVDPDTHTFCTETMCNISNTWTVGHKTNFSSGICEGTMLWSYTHQHVGAINSTMLVNGEPHCTSVAQYGTDPTNPPGNELGYVVNFTRCVDEDHLHNGIRLNKGDNLTIWSLYDVDEDSTRAHPMPGGKHGGIMALFFYYMSCDAGTFEDDYVCAQNSCVPVSKHSKKGKFRKLGDCLLECGV